MDPSRSHRLINAINNCEGPGKYKSNSNIFFLCFDLSFIKQQELLGVEPGIPRLTSALG